MLTSVIVPTLNEAQNLPSLVERIAAALAGRRYEVRVIDDGSTDDTANVCEALAARYPLHLHVREQPLAGLSGAVLDGITRAEGELIVVMDADLQHPPEQLPDLLNPLETGEAQFVVGSRYVPGGHVTGGWGVLRRIYSRAATLLAQPCAGSLHDPMSGYFAFKRSMLDQAQQITPMGYKIGLELLCKCGVRTPCEVPIHFGLRTHGESKLTWQQQVKYLEHLSRLYDFCYPRASVFTKFMAITTLGWLVGLGVFLISICGNLPRSVSPALAYLGVIGVTGVFYQRHLRTQGARIDPSWATFGLTAGVELMACAAAAQYVAHRIPAATGWEAWLISFGAATMVRYALRKELLDDLRGLRLAIH